MGSGFRAVLGKFRISGLGFRVGLGTLRALEIRLAVKDCLFASSSS